MAAASRVIFWRHLGFVILLFVNAERSAHGGEGPAWIRDLSQGIEVAREQQKDLLILFTGRGWCQPCMIFDAEVFQDDDFVRAAGEHFVFVEFDGTFARTPEGQALKATHRQLQKKFLCPSVPTVVLAASDGVPYAVLGYELGQGPPKTLEQYRAAQLARQERDRCFELARRAEGAERTAHLDAGIAAVAGLLGTIDDRGDDPVLTFYQPQIDEILAATGGGAPTIQQRYRDRIAVRDAWFASRSILARVTALTQAEDYRGAIALIENELPEVTDAAVRWELEVEHQGLLEQDGQYEEAIADARRLLERTDLSERGRDSLLDREAYSLFALGRIAEGVEHFDRRIAAAVSGPKRLDLLWDKAFALDRAERFPEAIATWRVYLDGTTPESFEWLSGHAFLARVLQRTGDHRDAIAHFDDVLRTIGRAKQGKVELTPSWTTDSDALINLEAAASHIALREFDEAAALIDQSEAAIDSLAASTQKNRQEHAVVVKERVLEMRSKLSAARAEGK